MWILCAGHTKHVRSGMMPYRFDLPQPKLKSVVIPVARPRFEEAPSDLRDGNYAAILRRFSTEARSVSGAELHTSTDGDTIIRRERAVLPDGRDDHDRRRQSAQNAEVLRDAGIYGPKQ